MITRAVSDAYWSVVSECLRTFHKLSATEADARISTFRERLAASPRGIDRNIIYHEEPFELACDLAGSRLDLRDYRQAYDEILTASERNGAGD